MSNTIAATESAVIYRSIRVDNLDIFYRESGPKDGPAILLLHGLPSSSRMFQPLLESGLSEHYHLIAPDYPGFGHSSWPNPKEFAYTFDSLSPEQKRIIGMIRAPVHILDAGHFAMDLKAAEIIQLAETFMKKQE